MARHYLFADESGNTDFSRRRGATRYFATGTAHFLGDSALAAVRADLSRLRTDLAWAGAAGFGEFHASEDSQRVRDAVFDVLRGHAFVADVTLFEKVKTKPHERLDDAAFFGFAWGEHFARLARDVCTPADELLIVVAAVGTQRLRAAIRRSLEQAPWPVVPRLVFAPAASDPALQVADYATWAAMRAAEREDPRALAQIDAKVRSRVDALRRRRTHYY